MNKQDTSKKFGLAIGCVVTGQRVDPATDNVVSEYEVNVWGGKYSHLDEADLVQVEAKLLEECEAEFNALQMKAAKVMSDFGLSLTAGEGDKAWTGQGGPKK